MTIPTLPKLGTKTSPELAIRERKATEAAEGRGIVVDLPSGMLLHPTAEIAAAGVPSSRQRFADLGQPGTTGIAGRSLEGLTAVASPDSITNTRRDAPPISEPPPFSATSPFLRAFAFSQQMHGRHFVEFFNEPARRATLGAFVLLPDATGREARSFEGSLDLLGEKMSEYYALSDLRAASGDPALDRVIKSQMGDLWDQSIRPVIVGLEESGFVRMEEAYGAKVKELGRELQPLKLSLAASSIENPGVRYDVVRTRPEELPRVVLDAERPENSFSKVGAGEVFAFEIIASNPEAVRGVVAKLERDGLLAPGFQYTGAETRIPVQVGRHHLNVRVLAAGIEEMPSRPLSRIETAAAGYEIAWNNEAFWSGSSRGNIPILMGDRVAVLEMTGELAPPTGSFGELAGLASRKITDAHALDRVVRMIQVLQSLHERSPVGGEGRRLIKAVESQMYGEIGRSASGEATLPALWLLTSEAVVEAGAQGAPVAVGREISVEDHVPTSDYDLAVRSQNWSYRWLAAGGGE